MTVISKNFSPDYPALKNIVLKDGYFADFAKMISTVSAKDILAKFNSEGALGNYERVARGEKGGHIGPPWYHGLLCECIRGISDLLIHYPDSELESELDKIVALIKNAQDADPENYINPFTTLMNPDKRWGQNGGSSVWCHEMYNSGALAEAAVHRYIASGKTDLLEVAVKMCNYLADFIGDAPKHNVVAEHSLPEEAFLKLGKLLKENKELSDKLGAQPDEYIRVARYFLEHKGDNETRYTFPKFFREYAQDHRPAREQREAIGHAVRAVLLYTGMTKMALNDNDEGLAYAAKAIWDDIAATKLHINGSVGAHRNEEKFGAQYELPNDAYLETCAGVGLVFFASEMFRMTGDASVWETVEATLYNLMPASVSEKGTEYTYENPLESRGTYERWSWHGCPCCPPMLLKLVGFMPQMIFASDDKNVWLNLYINSSVVFGDVSLSYENYRLTVDAPIDGKTFALRIRIPEWSRNFALAVDGKALDYTVENGYAVVNKTFANKEIIDIFYNTPVVKYEAHPYVRADYGRVAIKHGPVLYCAESIDNLPYEKWEDLDFELSDSELTLNANGTVTGVREDGKTFTLIPYRHWNNRGKHPMRVWFKQKGLVTDCMNTEGWEGKLYRPYREY